MLAYYFQEKKIHPTCSYLKAFYRQAAPNFAYSDKFEVKIPAYLFISAYLFIRELRVYLISTSKCDTNYVMSFEVYDGFIGQKILKL